MAERFVFVCPFREVMVGERFRFPGEAGVLTKIDNYRFMRVNGAVGSVRDRGIAAFAASDRVELEDLHATWMAASRFAEAAWQPLLLSAASYSCDEADAVYDLLMALGRDTWAGEFMERHAASDTEPGDRHGVA